jgi:farnesyl diphosphate synthase
MAFSLESWMAQHLRQVETVLDDLLGPHAPPGSAWASPAELNHAMRYAVLDGGKRLRPLLVLAAYEAVSGLTASGADAAPMRAACAVELIHAYSLVHDDMPCMDNDVLRRGKPTVHVQFGQAGALLAGDALQTLAFEVLTPLDGSVDPAVQARLCGILARASGRVGMAGGQAIDLSSVGQALSEDSLRHMHQLKTGALLQASVMMGAACGPARATALQALEAFGQAIGLAFQVVDDVLDVTADSATLGKTAGKDADNDKPTYVALLGLERSRAYAATLAEQAHAALQASGLPNTAALAALANMVVHRVH